MCDKLVVVASPLGRTGTSATMGILRLCGLNVGKKSSLSKASIMNPKGYFELKPFRHFMERIFGKYYGRDIMQIPSLDFIDDLSKKMADKFYSLLRSEFLSFPAAIKSQRFITIPMLYYLQDRLDIRVLSMNRDLKDQVKSTMRMWGKSKHKYETAAKFSFIKSGILKWRKFTRKIKVRYPLPYLEVHFEQLIQDSVETVKEIVKFSEIRMPLNRDIYKWIDKGLVNRTNI